MIQRGARRTLLGKDAERAWRIYPNEESHEGGIIRESIQSSVERDRARDAVVDADPAVGAVGGADHARAVLLEEEDIFGADLLAHAGPLTCALIDDDPDEPPPLFHRAVPFSRGSLFFGHVGNLMTRGPPSNRQTSAIRSVLIPAFAGMTRSCVIPAEAGIQSLGHVN